MNQKPFKDYDVFDDKPEVCPACKTKVDKRFTKEHSWVHFECGASFTTERWGRIEQKRSGWYWYHGCRLFKCGVGKLSEQLDTLLDIAEQALTGVDFEKREVLAFAPLVVLAQALWHGYRRGRELPTAEKETP